MIRENRERYDDLFEEATRNELIKINNFIESMTYEWKKHLEHGTSACDKRFFESMCQLLKRPKYVINQQRRKTMKF